MTTITQTRESLELAYRQLQRRRRPAVQTLFLAADEVDRARANRVEPLMRAVALYCGCAPDSVPARFVRSESFSESRDELFGWSPRDTLQRRLLHQLRIAIEALRIGVLVPHRLPCDDDVAIKLDENTLVDVVSFRRWAESALTVLGPWAQRGQRSGSQFGYTLKLTARPGLAHVVEYLEADFGREFAAGCSDELADEIASCCKKNFGVGVTFAKAMVRFLDSRPERRGRPAGRMSIAKPR